MTKEEFIKKLMKKAPPFVNKEGLPSWLEYAYNAGYTEQREDFIKAAVEWLKEHKEAVETEDNGIAGWIPDYFIEDFKKYMEEEV